MLSRLLSAALSRRRRRSREERDRDDVVRKWPGDHTAGRHSSSGRGRAADQMQRKNLQISQFRRTAHQAEKTNAEKVFPEPHHVCGAWTRTVVAVVRVFGDDYRVIYNYFKRDRGGSIQLGAMIKQNIMRG